MDALTLFWDGDANGSDVITVAAVDLGLAAGEYVFSNITSPVDSILGFVDSDGSSDMVCEGLGKGVVAPSTDGGSDSCPESTGDGSVVVSNELGSGEITSTTEGPNVAG